MILDDRTKEILEIDRLIKSAIADEYEEEVVNAFKLGHAPIHYCVNKLKLHDAYDFIKVVERYI